MHLLKILGLCCIIVLAASPPIYRHVRISQAQDAAAEVAAACIEGNRFMYMERKLKFRTALDKVPPDRSWEIETALNNRMIVLGCEPNPAAKR